MERGLPSLRRVSFGMRALLVIGAVAGSAGADAGDPATAESLFRAGKEKLAQKDYAHACPLLGDSYRSEPATGTMLALAICLEGQGKVASAWRAYTEVAIRSKRESRPDRERAANAKAASLEPQISLLTLIVSPDARDIDGLEIKRNGAAVSNTSWGKAIRVDGGSQLIEVSAPGRDRWHTVIAIAPKQDAKTVTIPALEETETPAPSLARPPPPEPPPSVSAVAPKVDVSPAPVAPVSDTHSLPETSTRISALQGAGIATFVAGVAGLGAGSFFAFRAISKNKASNGAGECTGNLCSAQGTQDRWDAHDAGNMATIGFVAGGVLTIGGAAMYLLARPTRVLSACSGATCVEAVPAVDGHGVGGFVRGSFW